MNYCLCWGYTSKWWLWTQHRGKCHCPGSKTLTVLSGVQLILTLKRALYPPPMWTYAGVALIWCFCDARCVFKYVSANCILLYMRQRTDQTPTHANPPLFSLINAGWREGRAPRSALRWPRLGKSNFKSRECEPRKTTNELRRRRWTELAAKKCRPQSASASPFSTFMVFTLSLQRRTGPKQKARGGWRGEGGGTH